MQPYSEFFILQEVVVLINLRNGDVTLGFMLVTMTFVFFLFVRAIFVPVSVPIFVLAVLLMGMTISLAILIFFMMLAGFVVLFLLYRLCSS